MAGIDIFCVPLNVALKEMWTLVFCEVDAVARVFGHPINPVRAQHANVAKCQDQRD